MERIWRPTVTNLIDLMKNHSKLLIIFATLFIAAILPLTIQTKVKLFQNRKM
jgi:hypothetical protein